MLDITLGAIRELGDGSEEGAFEIPEKTELEGQWVAWRKGWQPGMKEQGSEGERYGRLR